MLMGNDTSLVSTLCELKPTFGCGADCLGTALASADAAVPSCPQLSPTGWLALHGSRMKPSCVETLSPMFIPDCIALSSSSSDRCPSAASPPRRD